LLTAETHKKEADMENANSISYIIAGLGNFGKEYENTRHNAGFIAADALCKRLYVKADRQKYKSLVTEAKIADTRVLIMKPLTYMNDSGIAIREAAAFYKIPPERIIVLVDDINLDPGKLRLRRKGSHGGQNGLKSIIANIGSDNFTRIRIGIGQKPHPAYELAAWVLSGFTDADRKAVDSSLDRVCDTVELLIAGKDDEAMRLCNSN
jgi:PTH1 family peptidyl-tRNA hydrolase